MQNLSSINLLEVDKRDFDQRLFFPPFLSFLMTHNSPFQPGGRKHGHHSFAHFNPSSLPALWLSPRPCINWPVSGYMCFFLCVSWSLLFELHSYLGMQERCSGPQSVPSHTRSHLRSLSSIPEAWGSGGLGAFQPHPHSHPISLLRVRSATLQSSSWNHGSSQAGETFRAAHCSFWF